MFKKLLLVITLVSVSLFAQEATSTFEEENHAPLIHQQEGVDMQFGGSIEFESKYIWNGLNMAGGSVFQSSIYAAWKDFSVFVWTNMPMTQKTTAFNAPALGGKIDEVDLGIAYGHAFDHIVLDLSFTYFIFPQSPKKEVLTPDSSTTLIPSLSYETALALSTNFNIVNFSLPVYFNLSHGSLYLGPTLHAGYTFEGVIRPELSAKLGIGGKNYNAAQYGAGTVGKGSLNDFTSTFSLISDFGGPIGDVLTVHGWVSYATLINDDAFASLSQDRQNFWGGINLAVGF